MRSSPGCSIAIAALLAAGCSGSTPTADQFPANLSITPNVGFAGAPVTAVITGTGFLAKASQPSGGGSPTLDTRHRAWLGDAELTDVTWVSTAKLTATVPPVLEAGTYALTVENAMGNRGELKGAFTVLSTPAFSATASVDHPNVNVGQVLTLTFTVTNNGSSDITSFALATPTVSSTDGGSAICTGPDHAAPPTIHVGEQLPFVWTCLPAAIGRADAHISISVAATGVDSVSGKAVTAVLPAPVPVTIQQPAALTAVLDVDGSVALGTDFPIALKVTNTGGATARGVAPAALELTSTNGAAATLKAGPTPASADVPGGSSATFTWTYMAGSTRGRLTIVGSAEGADANQPNRQVSATAPSKNVTLAQAAIAATVKTPPPATITPGQSFPITVTFSNNGTANVTSFALGAPTVAPAGAAVTVVRTNDPPTVPNTLPAEVGSVDITWTVTPSAAGTFTVTFSASGRDSGTAPPTPLPATTQAVDFVVLPGPTISTLTVTSGPIAGGTQLTISGTGFQAGAAVTFGGTAATVGAVTATTIAVTTPAHAVGTVPVTVTNPDTQSVTLANGYTYQEAPGAPTAVVATAGNASAQVSWTAPASNGGSAITGYTVTSSPAGGVASTIGATTVSVTGLTNGTSYTFTVTATNAIGTGPASAPSNAVIPATVPDAPTNVTATAGNASATVSWTAPASNGGSAITGYTVTSSPAGGVASTTGATTVSVTGLTNGTSYTFTVTATNATGTSLASGPSNAVIPTTVPGAPTNVTATAGNASATVSWTAPANNGGSAIIDYTVTSSPGGLQATTNGLSTTVMGLTNGLTYTFSVAARNAVGIGPASSPSNQVIPTAPATAPGAPTGVTAALSTTSVGTVDVSWTAPASDGGSPITSYTVTATSTPAGGADGQVTPLNGTAVNVAGLTTGLSYTFTVTATNAIGTGPAASSNPLTAP